MSNKQFIYISLAVLAVIVLYHYSHVQSDTSTNRYAMLYAPWRSDYQHSPKSTTGCVFCNKTARHADEQEMILKRYKHHIVALNEYPYTEGHLLIVPFEHITFLDDLQPEARQELIQIMAYCVEVAKKAFHVDSVNVGINMGRVSGASIPDHLHVHVVPRSESDTSFLPVTAQTVVISSDIKKIFTQLKEYFKDA